MLVIKRSNDLTIGVSVCLALPANILLRFIA